MKVEALPYSDRGFIIHDRNLGIGYRRMTGIADMVALMPFQDIKIQTNAPD